MFLKYKKIIFKIRRSKVTDYAALTRRNYPSEASIKVARQLKIVNQIDAFTISATRNIQYAFKKLVCLIVFVKDMFDIYLSNIYHIAFSLH